MFTWEIISFVIVCHFFADFIFQKETWKRNKSTSMKALSLHCLTYGVIMLLCAPFYSLIWAVFNMLAHFVVDYFTSRWMKPMWEEEKYNDFFVLLGLDQMAHYLILFGSYQMFYNAGFVHFFN